MVTEHIQEQVHQVSVVAHKLKISQPVQCSAIKTVVQGGHEFILVLCSSADKMTVLQCNAMYTHLGNNSISNDGASYVTRHRGSRFHTDCDVIRMRP